MGKLPQAKSDTLKANKINDWKAWCPFEEILLLKPVD
jgi:hypothetical protein